MTDATLAAGAAIWRPTADASQEPQEAGGAEVLLVHRPKYDDWSLPKGKSDPGEHILLTAVREVWEETCVRPVLGPRLPTVEYISWGQPKRVSYWSAFSTGHEAAPGNEIDAVAWVPLAQARAQLADTHDDPVISAFLPRQTVPLILVRHASAGRKADWPRRRRVTAARCAGRGRRAGPGPPAGLLRAHRAGDQLARAALHRDPPPVRGELRGDRRG